MFALSPENKVQLWEMTKDAIADQPDGDSVPIEWAFESGGYSFPDSGFDEKKLLKGWIWFENIQGECTVGFQFRANGTPQWRPWHSYTFCSTMDSCNLAECAVPASLQPQTRRPYLLPNANPVCDTPTEALTTIGEWFQVRFSGTGALRLPKFLLSCAEVDQAVNKACTTTETCRAASVCADDGFDYSSYG